MALRRRSPLECARDTPQPGAASPLGDSGATTAVSRVEIDPARTTSAETQPRPTGRGPDRAVVALAVATALCTYGLIVLGSTVRVTNSGMGCPSWPLCFGQIGPVDRYHALLEQSHRYLVALVTVGIFSTALVARRSPLRKMALVPALSAGALVLVQAGLGALTVLAKNAPWTVALHLVVGFVFFATTVVTAVAAWRAPERSWSFAAVGRWGWSALGATLALVIGGSLVVANNAAAACPSWPICTHPASDGLIAWQLLHRSLAGITGICIVGFVASRWHGTAGWRSWRTGAAVLIALVAVAGSFGAASALSRGAPAWQDAHLALAAMVWGLLVVLVTTLATRAPRTLRTGTAR